MLVWIIGHQQLRCCLTLLLVTFSFLGVAQEYSNKSLMPDLPGTRETVDSLNEWAFSEMRVHPNQALGFALKSLEIANSIGYKQGIGDAYSRLGYYYLSRNVDSAESYYLSSINIRKDLGQFDLVASCYNSLGLLSKRKGGLIEALDFYEKGIELCTDPKTKTTLFKNRSAVYRDLGDLSQAYDDIFLALNALGKDSGSRIEANSFLQLGTILTRQSRYEEAQVEFIKALKIFTSKSDLTGMAKANLSLGNTARFMRQFDEALTYFRKANKSFVELGDLRSIAGCWNSIGQVHLDLENYGEAELAFYRCEQTAVQAGDNLLIAKANYHLGCVYSAQKQIDRAIEFALNSESLADSISALELRLEVAELIANIYVQGKNWQGAVTQFLHHIELRDSVEHDQQELTQLQRLYHREKEKLREAKKEKAIQELKSKRRELVTWGIGVVAALIIVVVFFGVRNRHQKQQREIVEKEKLLLESRVDELLSNQELKSISAVLEAQDEERRRIAQDLHDRLGSMLSMIKVHFENVEEEIARFVGQTEKDYSKAIDLLDKATEEVRQIAHNLVSGPLKKFGLEAGLIELCKAVESASGITVELNCLHLKERLSFDFEVNIYRIIQELLANVMKHSKASDVSIQVIRLNGDLSIMVVDNGKGFDPTISNEKTGMGLKNVQSRVDKLGGTIELDSNKGNGTSISIQVTLKNKENDQGFVG